MRGIRGDMIFLGCLVIFVVLFGLFSSNIYHIQLLSMVGIWSIAAIGLNLVLGGAGQLSIAQGGFMALGAYTSLTLLMRFDQPFIVGLLGAIVITIPLGLFVGYSALRLKGNYLAMATVAFAGAIFGLALHLEYFGGASGIRNIPGISFGGWEASTPVEKYWVIWAFVVVSFLLAISLLNSRIGRALAAIREDEQAAKAAGINIAWYKIQVFIISGILGGIAGCLYASYLNQVNPFAFDILRSALILVMVVIGGMGSMPGTILGVVFITILPEFGRQWEEYRLTAYGLLIILLLIFAPKGLSYIFSSIGRNIFDRINRYTLIEKRDKS
jgi:branched-chain amino acid transport system permease protein